MLKEKRRKRKRSRTDRLKHYKNESKHVFDSILLDTVDENYNYDNFKEYKNDMESFTFSDIFLRKDD